MCAKIQYVRNENEQWEYRRVIEANVEGGNRFII